MGGLEIAPDQIQDPGSDRSGGIQVDSGSHPSQFVAEGGLVRRPGESDMGYYVTRALVQRIGPFSSKLLDQTGYA